MRVDVPSIVDSALQRIEERYDRPLDVIGDVIARSVTENRDYPWKLTEVKSLCAEARLADMFAWLGEEGYDVGFVEGTGMWNDRYWLLPSGIGKRVRVYHFCGDNMDQIQKKPNTEFDLVAWVNGYPVVGESKSGRNSYHRRIDFYRKVAMFRRALPEEAHGYGNDGPTIVLGVPDNHELAVNENLAQSLYRVGGRMLKLQTGWERLDSYATSLCSGLGISC